MLCSLYEWVLTCQFGLAFWLHNRWMTCHMFTYVSFQKILPPKRFVTVSVIDYTLLMVDNLTFTFEIDKRV